MDVFEHRSSEIDDLDLYLKEDVDAGWVGYYVQNYFMIPSDWMERAVLKTVDGEELSKTQSLLGESEDIDIHDFVVKTSDTTVLQSDYAYMFVFGGDIVSSPLTFFSQPVTSCDGLECEASLGETPETCCIDCGCRQAEQECDTSADYPSGLCHVCGDGVKDPVENSTTCCADAGCPGGKSCDTSRNEPYGTCVDPDCGNGRCDEPEEDATSCCIDCGGNAACEAALGSGFYCNTELVMCVEPICGERGCEPGEDHTNCCLDCGGCPAGEYCNTTLSENGVCIMPGCGSNGCEPGEDSQNCCIDCGCPLDSYTGFEQTCTQNMCHLCGNDVVESPVETEETCCPDTGCTEGYCADDYSCRNTDEMGINVFIEPEYGVDCLQEGNIILPISVTITPENRAYYFSYFGSAFYSAYGKTMPLKNCVLNGNAYECEIPLEGSDIYVGCFEGTGTQQVTVSTMVGYYEDSDDYYSREITETLLSETVDINVERSKERICNRMNGCEPELGEDQNFCCHDCGCPYGFVCLDNTCSTENDIGLEVDESSIPDEDYLVCNRDEMVLDTVTFSADVINLPHTDRDPFNLVTYGLEYDGRTYGSHNLTGFYCEPETTSNGLLTGKVSCGIPISVFPPCPYPSPQELGLMLWVTGGGLSEYYSYYSGKMISDEFTVHYTQGLPTCNDGLGTCDEGENQNNCCQDCGCPGGMFCSVLYGCVSGDEFTFIVWVEPDELDCSSSLGKTVKIFGEVGPKPIGTVSFEDTMLDGEDIQFSCSTGPYTKYGSSYILECEIPYQNFDYCWTKGRHNAAFETTFSYENAGTSTEVDFEGTASFTVTTPRDRGCDEDMYCDSADGEAPVLCCRGCGCTEGDLCNYMNECTENEPGLIITEYPSTVDCSGYDEVIIEVTITDQPYWTNYIDWNISVDGYEIDISNYCSELGANKYICELSVRELPVCIVPEDGSGCTAGTEEGTYDCTREMGLLADVSYMEPVTFDIKPAEPEAILTMTGENILASCGDDICDRDIGENYISCCEDCPCPDGEICTLSPLPGENDNCIPVEDIELTLPDRYESVCYLAPSRFFEYEWPPNEDVIDPVLRGGESDNFGFECRLPKPVKLDMELTYNGHDIMPYGLDEVITGSFEVTSYGELYPPQEVYVDTETMEVSFLMWDIGAATKELIPESLDIKVLLSLDVIAPGGNSVVPITSENYVQLLLEKRDGEILNDLESVLKKFRRWLNTLGVILGLLAMFLAFCAACPGNAAANPLGKIQNLLHSIEQLKWQILFISGLTAGSVGIIAAVPSMDLGFIAERLLVFVIGGAALGGILAAVAWFWKPDMCLGGTIWSKVCDSWLWVSTAFLVAAAVSVSGILFGSVEKQYQELKEEANRNLGEDGSTTLLPPYGFG